MIVCERPKIGPHRAAMAARLAEVLGLGADQVSIKATTSERLGFTGRGEGIAAQAVVSVALRGLKAGERVFPPMHTGTGRETACAEGVRAGVRLATPSPAPAG